MHPALSYDRKVKGPIAAAIERVTGALQAEGFGILTRADVHSAFREKLNVGFRPYVILGACNPPLAHRALSARPEVGLLLPCNVVVEETGKEECLVRIVNPEAMMLTADFATDPRLVEVAKEAAVRLRRVAERLG